MTETLEELERLLAASTRRCEAAGVSINPWESQDNPLSVEHWRIFQHKSALYGKGKMHLKGSEALVEDRPKRTLSAARLAALKAGREQSRTQIGI